MKVQIRDEADGDQDAIRQVHQDAFGGVIEADLVEALRDGGDAAVSMVAESGTDIVGHILFSTVQIQTQTGQVPALSLAPMAVVTSRQRSGIGMQLLRAGLDRCQSQGHRIVLVLGHPRFYSRGGFSAHLAQQIGSPFGGGDSWMALELVDGALQGVVGEVQFSPPFDAFK